MSQYTDSLPLLGSDSIRLLSVMPSKVDTAPIQCQLHIYDFQESDKGTHLYEALSYVWGSFDDPPQSVSVNGQFLHVTTNLYAALLRLRDRTFERIIWVDAICINQKDKEEKSRQIQLMAKIYSKADRVIVYLGEVADNTDQTIEYIRSVAEEDPVYLSTDKKNQEAILELLRRPWFQRIWVLQEVALARRILMVYGSAKINGYTFCSGISNLQLSYKDHSDLQSLIRPIIYLIRGAIFRPIYAMGSSRALSLGELVDMYHTRKATERHDKVYALLSISSDHGDSNLAGLSPDYTVPWKILMQRLIKFVLSKEVSVETWDNKEIAVIEGKGCVIGHVSSVETDSTRSDRQLVGIIFNNTSSSLQYKKQYGTQWTLQASAQHIRQYDLVCLLQGASKPVIIRAYKYHFALVMIAVTLRQRVRTESGYIESQQPLPSMRYFSRDFLLIWNWEKGLENLQDRAGDESSVEINALVPGYLTTDAKKMERSIKTALILGDTKNYEEAEYKIGNEMKNYEEILGREDLRILALKESLAWIYKGQRHWREAENLILEVIQIREGIQGIDHQDIREGIAKLVSIYMDERSEVSEVYRDDDLMIRLTDRIRDNIQVEGNDIIKIADLDDGRVMTLLLGLNGNKILVTENVLKAAARNRDGKVMMVLLEKRGADVVITEEVVKEAASNIEVMILLLEKRGAEVVITEEVLKEASWNIEVIALLLEKRRAEMVITEEVLKKAVWKPKVMALLLEKRAGVVITEELVKIMVGNWYHGEEIMALLLEKRGAEVVITEEVVKAAAGNKEEVMRLLLEKRGADVVITEEVVKAAVRSYGSHGEKIMKLLLEKRGAEVVITEEIVKAAVRNEDGEKVMILLLEKRGAEVVITEEIVKAAVRNYFMNGKKMMKLLLEKRGTEVGITEMVVKAIAEHSVTSQITWT